MFQGIQVSGIREAVEKSLDVISRSREWSNAAKTELASILRKFVNRWEIYMALSEDERWWPRGPYTEILRRADQYAEELFESAITNQNALDGEAFNLAKGVFNQMKQFSQSQILSIGRSDYEELEKRGAAAYNSAIALLSYLKSS